MQVVVSLCDGLEVPAWEDVQAGLSECEHDEDWCPAAYVAPGMAPNQNKSLAEHVRGLTAFACKACYHQTGMEYHQYSQLEQHIVEEHEQHLCSFCLEVWLHMFCIVREQQKQLDFQSIWIISKNCIAHMCCAFDWFPLTAYAFALPT